MGRLPDGRAVFVPFTLPGETARVELIEEKRAFARARLIEVLRPSPERIRARCAHFQACGGCHYQHMSYQRQLAAKEEILRDQFERIAGIHQAPVKPVLPSPLEWNYRNNLQFHLDEHGRLGFQAAASHKVIPITECHLPEEALNDLWPRLEMDALSGIQRAHLRLGSGDELLLALESSDPLPPEFSVDMPLSAVHLGPAGRLILAGDDFLIMDILGRPFKVRADSFFQVNRPVAEAMVQYLMTELPADSQVDFLDVFCGVGLFSAFLAPRYRRCLAVESSPSACDDFIDNLSDYDNVELYIGAAETVLPALQIGGGVAVVDPPRAGLDRAALDALVTIRPRVLAYVSCDPATLARDAKRLISAGYRLQSVQPFDLFPQTYHIESISLFTALP